MAAPSEPNSRPPVRTRTRTIPQPAEQWRPIPFFEGVYEISDRGSVKRVATEPKHRVGRLLTIRRTPSGRPTVELYCDRPIGVYVDQLVIEVFQRATPDMVAALVLKKDIRQINPELRRQDQEAWQRECEEAWRRTYHARLEEEEQRALDPPPAPEPDLHQLLGLDAEGLPDPTTAYELHLEERSPELAYELQFERCAAHATRHLLELAVANVESVMGASAAHAFPEIVASFMECAAAIRNQDLMVAELRRRGSPRK
jgi:hypothetical protein